MPRWPSASGGLWAAGPSVGPPVASGTVTSRAGWASHRYDVAACGRVGPSPWDVETCVGRSCPVAISPPATATPTTVAAAARARCRADRRADNGVWDGLPGKAGGGGAASTSARTTDRIAVSRSFIECLSESAAGAGEVASDGAVGDAEVVGDSRGVHVCPVGQDDDGALPDAQLGDRGANLGMEVRDVPVGV